MSARDRETPTSNDLQLLDHLLPVGQLTLHLILKIICRAATATSGRETTSDRDVRMQPRRTSPFRCWNSLSSFFLSSICSTSCFCSSSGKNTFISSHLLQRNPELNLQTDWTSDRSDSPQLVNVPKQRPILMSYPYICEVMYGKIVGGVGGSHAFLMQRGAAPCLHLRSHKCSIHHCSLPPLDLGPDIQTYRSSEVALNP